MASNEHTVAKHLPMVSFSEAILRGFSNYANFEGRATRAESWWWLLFTMFVGFVLSIADLVSGIFILAMLFRLGTLLPSLAVGVRRLHDINRSGWWLLLGFVPLVGWLVLIVWAIKQGDLGDNRYGSDPRQSV